MIGTDTFGTCFGGMAPGDSEKYANIVRGAIRNGFSPVILKPGSKEPVCIYEGSSALRMRADAEHQSTLDGKRSGMTHPCGFKHVLDDPAKVSTIVTRLSKLGPLNIGIHLGRSRRIVVDTDTPAERQAFEAWWRAQTPFAPPAITVESPGRYDEVKQTWVHHGGGHWVFTLPEGYQVPSGKTWVGPGGFSVMWGESYVLVPPSVRSEGPYRLVGGEQPAPRFLLDAVTSAGVVAAANADRERNFILDHNDPIEQWSAWWSWEQILTKDGWVLSGGHTDCGCPEFTAPGEHSSPKSATGHQVGCTLLDTQTGWGPLHIWTTNPPRELESCGGTVTKMGYVALIHFGGDLKATLRMIEQQMGVAMPQLVAFQGGGVDPFVPEHRPVLTQVGGLVALPWSELSRPLKVQPASEIQARATRWLWKIEQATWIALGGLTLLSGREGIGKSTWAYQLAAQVSRGTLPGAFLGTPRGVVIAATEDAWEQTVVPRLMAAGADLARILRVDAEGVHGLESLSLPGDMAGLELVCRAHEVALILLDPLMGTIAASLDTHKDAEVRRALEPVSRLAHDLQIAVVGLIHQSKATKGDLLTKLMGSRAFSAVARAVLVAAVDPNPGDEDASPDAEQLGPRYVLGQAKNNLGALVPYSIRYRIDGVQVGYDQDLLEPIYSSHVTEIGVTDERIGDIADQEPEKVTETSRRKAGLWIKSYLDQFSEPQPWKEIKAKGFAEGFNERTLQRSAKDNSVLIVRDGSKPGSPTYWSLPSLS